MALYRDQHGKGELQRSFVGRFRPPKPRNDNHAAGFDQALRNALDVFDAAVKHHKNLGLPGTFNVQISFEAEVEVRSPGNIGEYRAIVTESTGG